MLLTDLIRQNVEKFGEYSLFYFEDQVYSNVDTQKAAQRIGQELQREGIEKGDRVIVCMPNRPEVIFSYQGILQTGAIVIPVMFLLHPQEIQFIVSDSETRAIITSSILLPKILESISGLQVKPKIFVVDGNQQDTNELGIQVINLTERILTEAAEQSNIDLNENDVAVILYTSGTTGKPKGVMLTHRNLYSNADSAAKLYEDEERGTTLGVLPLAHVYGFTVSNTLFLRGSTMVVFSKYDLDDVCRAIEKHKVKSFSAVPAMIHNMVASSVTEKYDLSSLESVGSGLCTLTCYLDLCIPKKIQC